MLDATKEKLRPIEDTLVDVILRDGTTMRLRPPARHDADALVRFFAELSDQSLYLRFHGHPSVDARLVSPNLEPDWAERGARGAGGCGRHRRP